MTSETTWYEDGRTSVRVCAVFAYLFLIVAGLMRMDGAIAWPLFVGLAILIMITGLSALFGGRRPMLAISDAGLRVFAGRVGLGGRGGGGHHMILWDAIETMAFEVREIVGGSGRQSVTVLAFRITTECDRPDGHKGFLQDLVGRGSELALGQFLTWDPETRKIDLLAKPRRGFSKLTAAIVEHAPHLADPSAEDRSGLGGSLLYACFDLALAVALIGTAWLVAVDDMGPYVKVAKRLLEWGGGLPLV